MRCTTLFYAILISSFSYLMANSITVIPPGPVTDKSVLEIRVNLSNSTQYLETLTLKVFLDTISETNLVADSTQIELISGESELISFWVETRDIIPGNHLIIVETKDTNNNRSVQQWPIEIISEETAAVTRLSGGWIDPGVLIEGWGYPRNRAVHPDDIRNAVDAMQRIGMSTIIITYVEYKVAFYPSNILDFPYYGIDVIELILDQAGKNGMHVFLGLGRGTDDLLLWEGLGDYDRIQRGIKFSTEVAQELWELYGHHRSFYGWYLTHEANLIGLAANYYNPVADFCHTFSPDKPVMIAPAGTPIISEWLLNTSKVDIFAYQDAVGAGYKDYQYTGDPEIRIADLDSVFSYYSSLHQNTKKHIWTDLEIWRSNPQTGYTPFVPAPMEQIERQIAIEAKYVDFITGYEFLSMMEPPESTLKLGGDGAVHLYNQYMNYYTSHYLSSRNPRRGKNIKLGMTVYPNPFNSSTLIRITNPNQSRIEVFEIFNVLGRRIRTFNLVKSLDSQIMLNWDGKDDRDKEMPQGVYFGRLMSSAGAYSVKLLYIK